MLFRFSNNSFEYCERDRYCNIKETRCNLFTIPNKRPCSNKVFEKQNFDFLMYEKTFSIYFC